MLELSKTGPTGYTNLLDLITVQFPSCSPSLLNIFQTSSRIMPRYYTIASSSLMYPDKIRIAISLTVDGQWEGFASKFLNDMYIGATKKLVVKHLQHPLFGIGSG